MIVFLIFVVLYIVGIIGWLYLTYSNEKEYIETIGDLLDESKFFMYIPIFNIVVLIATLVIFGCAWLVTYFEIDELCQKLWEKFRDIKIKK